MLIAWQRVGMDVSAAQDMLLHHRHEDMRLHARNDASDDLAAVFDFLRRALSAVLEQMSAALEEKVIQFHPAHEEAVSLYFDYAHSFAVLTRLDEMGAEMNAMIELTTGHPATDVVAATYSFPD